MINAPELGQASPLTGIRSAQLRALAAVLYVARDALLAVERDEREDSRDAKIDTLRDVLGDIADEVNEQPYVAARELAANGNA
jgi:hypothetical protein